MLKTNFKILILCIFMVSCGAALAGPEPTLQQVYAAASSGHLDQAQQMMDQVLRDHPNSAKAHYVAAEIAARQGNAALAREELSGAERLEPGLPFAKPEAVQALKAELAAPARPSVVASHSSFPWGMALIVLAGLAIFWMIMRRPSSNGGYPSSRPVVNTAGGMPGSYGSPGVGGGMGSNIVNGLASGLAVGAGVVAAEELAHHFMDRGHGMGSGMEPLNDGFQSPPVNADMGGNDFGVNDPGSWDDSSFTDDTRGGDWN